MELRQVAISISDLARATSFYRELLGAEPTATFPGAKLAFFSLNSTRLLLDGNISKTDQSGFVYLSLGDVREVVALLRSRGVEIATEPHIVFNDSSGTFDHPGNEWLAFFKDSEGNLIGLMSREKTE